MITGKKLEDFGFIKKTQKNEDVYYKDTYGLKSELGSWLIIGKHSGIELTGMSIISTIAELKKHYKESTGNDLE